MTRRTCDGTLFSYPRPGPKAAGELRRPEKRGSSRTRRRNGSKPFDSKTSKALCELQSAFFVEKSVVMVYNKLHDLRV